MKRHGLDLQFAPEESRSDREIVLEVVKQNGLGLEHASEGVRSDREAVPEVVKQSGCALEFASEGSGLIVRSCWRRSSGMPMFYSLFLESSGLTGRSLSSR